MNDEKDYQFYHFEKESFAEKLLKKHITRLINKLNEKLSSNDNIKTIKCLEEQLHQILEKLKKVNDEYISIALNPDDIETSREIYFEQHSRVTLISQSIEQFILKKQQVQNAVQQDHFREILKSKSSHSSKSKSSKLSKSSKTSKSSSRRESPSCKKAKAELLSIQVKERLDRKKKLLEKQKNLELELENEHVIEAQNKLQLIKLGERFEQNSRFDEDEHHLLLEDIQKPEVYNESDTRVPLANQERDYKFNKEYLKRTSPPESDTTSVNHLEDMSSINKISTVNKISSYGIERKKSPISTPQLKPSDHSYSDILTSSSHQIEPVDLFIDRLVEGQETILESTSNEKITVLSAVHQQLEARNLPPIELLTFDGNPGSWSEFIENFKIMIHCKSTFNDTIRLERLLNVLRGDAKRSVDSIGRNGIFYATTLKCLKREFRNHNVITHIKLKQLFDQPQIKASDCTSLKLYHQKLKCTNTWLASIRYHSTLSSIENVTKAVQRLPNYLRQTFYRHTREIIETDTISLIEFEKWFENRIKELFNPIADIVASQEIHHKKDPLTRRVNNGNVGEKEEVKCWFCSQKHKVTTCQDFINTSLKDINEFVKTNKLCLLVLLGKRT